MPEKIVKRVRRDDEPHYDPVRTSRGRLEKRPIDATQPKPAATPDPQPPAAKTGDTDTSA